MTQPLPSVALSIRQPWAWLIVNGIKSVENRTWQTNFRGPVLIHAGQKIERDVSDQLMRGVHPVTGKPLKFELPDRFDVGGIVGIAEMTDCVTEYQSSWFVGPFGFVLRNARPLPFMPMSGQLGFFKATYVAPTVSA